MLSLTACRSHTHGRCWPVVIDEQRRRAARARLNAGGVDDRGLHLVWAVGEGGGVQLHRSVDGAGAWRGLADVAAARDSPGERPVEVEAGFFDP